MTSQNSKIAITYIAVLIASVVLYTASCAPSFLWQDSGMIQYRVWNNDIEGKLGLALAHPLFYVLAICAKYVPISEFAHRVNMVSAIAAAVAVANLFLLLRLWLNANWPALIASFTFALSHTFWRHASIAETYSLYIALFLAGLIMLLQYFKTSKVGYLYVLGLSNGLALANHMFASIPLVCYIVLSAFLLVKKRISLRDLAIIIVCWVVGAGLYGFLILRNIVQTGDFWGTLASAAFGSYQQDVLNTVLSARIVKENFLFILLNFPTPNILLFFAGCFALFKFPFNRTFRNVLLGMTILFFLFAFRYTVVDRYAFFIPFYCMVSVLTGVGFFLLRMRTQSKVLVYLVLLIALLPVPVYTAAPSLAKKMHFSMGVKRDIPYRDNYRYFLQPWRAGYRGADKFAEAALDEVDENAIICADNTTVYPLLLAQQVKEKRPDVKIVSRCYSSKNAPAFNEDTAADFVVNPGVYVVSPLAGYCPRFLLDFYDFVQNDLLWKVTARNQITVDSRPQNSK
ncbi:MAG: protein O-mannosyl-transferase family [Planctomycetota bacterium]